MNDGYQRRLTLRSHAARALLNPDKAKATRDILMWAARLVEDVQNPASTMMGDLKAVMIGEGYTDGTGRGRGPHYVETHPLLKNMPHRGSEGFKYEYRDGGFQVHHVIAAILLGHWPLWSGELAGVWTEVAEMDKVLNDKIEWHDVRIYQDFCPFGRRLNDQNYHLLAKGL